MIGITLDLGKAPSVLQALADERVAQLVANAAAESYTDDMLDWIAEGKAFKSREGQLEQSIGWRPTGGGAAEVYANADYAGYVEHGTGIHAGHQPWIIRPRYRKALKIPVSGGGGYVLRREVKHSGSKPKPFFFADREAREERMLERARSVLAQVIAEAQ